MAVGDGRVKVNYEPKVMAMIVNVDDIVLFQMNSIQAANSMLPSGSSNSKDQLYILNQGDCIARLSSTVVKLETVEMLGIWSLVEPYIEKPQSGIILPENVDPVYSGIPRFKLIQKGTHVKADIEAGQELVCEKSLVNRMDFDGKSYGFVSEDRIYGYVIDNLSSLPLAS